MILLSDIDTLVRTGESDAVEFKASFNRETIESLCAFANSKQLSWDAYPAPDTTLNDPDVIKTERFISRVNAAGRFVLGGSWQESLEKLDLIRKNKPSNAAKLLFAKELKQYSIHVGRFKTPSMIIDDKMIKNTLYEAVEETMRFIVSHLKVAFEFTGEIQRTEIFNIHYRH